MKLASSLNAINLIISGVVSTGVVGVAVVATTGNGGSGLEGSGTVNESEMVEELEVEKTTEEKFNEQEDDSESVVPQNNTTIQPSATTITPTANNNTPTPTPTTTTPIKQETSNITGLPDTISRYEWVRQGGWRKLVEAAYFKAIDRGATAMYNGADWSVMYYQIVAMATDPCYASIYVELEVDGETKMAVTSADLIAAPGAICDSMRPQVIDVPTLSQLTDYLHQAEAKYGLYQKIKGSSKS